MPATPIVMLSKHFIKAVLLETQKCEETCLGSPNRTLAILSHEGLMCSPWAPTWLLPRLSLYLLLLQLGSLSLPPTHQFLLHAPALGSAVLQPTALGEL